MNSRTETLKQLIDQSSYPIDEAAVAEAIVVRSLARRAVPDVVFQAPPPKPRIRSFRPHRGQSFRIARPERSRHRQMTMAVRIGSPAMR